jgi:RimJ/RimL family protein N-acetyltransferase
MERGSWQVMAGKGAGDGAAQEAGHAFWRLFDLVVRTPRLEIRLPREEEFGALLAVIAAGVHDPATMPFTTPFTDRPSPERERESAQWWWRQRAEWTPERWNLTGAVLVDGEVVGVQDIDAERFATLRSVHTGSWLGLAHQGQGLGKEMRQAILHLTFAGLGALEAHSGAFFDNEASLATSRSVGYEPNGEALAPRRDGGRAHDQPPHRPGQVGGAPAPRHRARRRRGVPRHVHRSTSGPTLAR